ncbi:MAG: MarR family transcriptional regulator [Microbacterium sp.]
MAETPQARADAVRDLETQFAGLFLRVRGLIAAQAERVSPGLLPGAYKVFATIVRREAVTPSVLAETMLMDKGQLSRTIRELEQLGLVHRTPDPHDRRASLLSPTADGLARLEAARSSRKSPLHAALREWELDDIRSLTRLLHALVADERPAAGPGGGSPHASVART